ncbi:hypothetical protein [Solimicrobium silvestre]|uniref:Uncharacterized protein n=1 Tax=Solimicrobium silvestre TaxID=2099400 RepID=A0A2S9GVH7_9BURK|nr:hypothetical protein [Solimicrobium silvestre]PRC91727.1 hypothetical protein S2091_3482 [Solimicrobium silvestre]
MSRQFLPILFYFVIAPSISSITVGKEVPCHYEESRIVGYEMTTDFRRLSYITADGQSVFLAEAGDGAILEGDFRAARGTKSEYFEPWADVSEVRYSDPKLSRKKLLDFKIIYVPLNYALKSVDLGLSDDWKIYNYVYDYDQHKKTYDEKVWQFLVKNTMTGATNTIIASDVEKVLLARCNLKHP